MGKRGDHGQADQNIPRQHKVFSRMYTHQIYLAEDATQEVTLGTYG